jgi:3-hydroxyacyl-[acyl-carrier-protein] dehydratase
MKFVLLDRIVSLEPERSIVTRKSLTLAEEYLADHFPTFPVMPGVLMLEALIQSAAWLVRATTDFAASMVVLEEARNVTYKSFVSPGQTLELRLSAGSLGPRDSEFRGVGLCGPREVVKAQLRLRHYNLAEQSPELAPLDRALVQRARATFELLGGPAALSAPAEASRV